VIVATMNTAKTASSVRTMAVCARSTMREPIRLMPGVPRMTAVVKTLSQAGPASSPMNSDVA
jgi:hypothetical protein